MNVKKKLGLWPQGATSEEPGASRDNGSIAPPSAVSGYLLPRDYGNRHPSHREVVVNSKDLFTSSLGAISLPLRPAWPTRSPAAPGRRFHLSCLLPQGCSAGLCGRRGRRCQKRQSRFSKHRCPQAAQVAFGNGSPTERNSPSHPGPVFSLSQLTVKLLNRWLFSHTWTCGKPLFAVLLISQRALHPDSPNDLGEPVTLKTDGLIS